MPLEHLNRRPRSLHQEILLAGGEPDQFELLLQFVIIKGLPVLRFPFRPGIGSEPLAGNPEYPGAVNTEVAELVQESSQSNAPWRR